VSVFVNVKADTKILDRIRASVKKLDRAYVKVGVLGSKGGDQKHDAESGFTMIELAAVHEFGTSDGRVPERAWIRLSFQTSEKELSAFIAPLAAAVVQDKMDIMRALGLVGQWGVAEVRRTVTQSDIPPPLADSTIARKGSDRPLLDTGRMLQSVQYEIVTNATE
jgi:hypothetical protein